jgi:ATPase family associated with various cellular activities (AAA)/Domain of unknown function (DUF5925)
VTLPSAAALFVPTHDSIGPFAYLWPFAYDLPHAYVAEMTVRNCETAVAELPALYAAGGRTIDVVLDYVSAPDDYDPDDYPDDCAPDLFTESDNRQIVYDLHRQLRVSAVANGKQREFTVIGDRDDVNAEMAWLREHFPEAEAPGGQVQLDFIHGSANGGVASSSRSITAVSWSEIHANYATSVQPQLEELMKLKLQDQEAGKAVILLGPPGTGKTHLIRALAHEWRDWARLRYVLDPERFFSDPEYMMSVILRENRAVYSRGEGMKKVPWSVLLFEDSEDYIAPDSRKEIGQALSRLVNLGDGLIGQGLKLLMLFTTNAPDAKLHQAVSRPGRCLARVEVPLLSAAEASVWLGETVTEPMSLAAIYERRGQIQQIVHENGVVAVPVGQYL